MLSFPISKNRKSRIRFTARNTTNKWIEKHKKIECDEHTHFALGIVRRLLAVLGMMMTVSSPVRLVYLYVFDALADLDEMQR